MILVVAATELELEAAPGGRLLAMKGVDPKEELAALPKGFKVLKVHPLRVPGLDADRCLVELEKT